MLKKIMILNLCFQAIFTTLQFLTCSKAFFCARSAQIIYYGHFEHIILRTRLFLMTFFVNLLISEIFFLTVFQKRGPGYLKIDFDTSRASLIVLKYIYFSNIFDKKKSEFEKFPEYHLILKICQCEQLGEQAKYIVKCTMLKKKCSRDIFSSENTN